MEFNVLGLILKLQLMPKISTDTPLSKTGVALAVTKKDRRLVITGLGLQKPVLIGPVWFFDASDI